MRNHHQEEIRGKGRRFHGPAGIGREKLGYLADETPNGQDEVPYRGEISGEDYHDVKAELESRIAQCEQELKTCSISCSNFSEYASTTLQIASSLGSEWEKMNFKVCQERGGHKKQGQRRSVVLFGSGRRTRTTDLRVMSPTSYQLLYPAMLDYKSRYNFLINKEFLEIFLSAVWKDR